MELTFGSRLKHAWNAFTNRDPTVNYKQGYAYSYRPDRVRFTRGNERSIVTSVYNRIALDAAAVQIKHCRLDDDEQYVETIKSGLNNCLNLEANIDQTGRSFIQDAVMSMLDEGCVALVPIDTDLNPKVTQSYDILSMRTAKVLEWRPAHVVVRVYNDKNGQKEDVILPKNMVAIIENPLYAVINEPNSTAQRLTRKLALLDAADEQTVSGQLNLIVQLPYVIKSEARKQQAELRRKEIETQLTESKYGVAYTDGTERITQLNRPLENNLMKQIEYLQNLLFSQLGITQTILDGTADEQTMLNYYNRSIEPIVSAIVDEMKRKFLTKTARTQGQSIMAFRDPFKLVPVNNIAEITDKFTRNEVLTSNEIRQIIGMKPSNDPKADQLLNSNISHPEQMGEEFQNGGMTQEDYNMAMNELDSVDADLDNLESEVNDEEIKHYASEYYDPVKAHEYYMRTRELKGGTAKLNDEGKAAVKYVKDTLTAERKQKVTDHSNTTNSKIETLREQKKNNISSHTEQMKSKIEQIRNSMKSMSSAEKIAKRKQINKTIEGLREENAKQREALEAEFKGSSTSLREDHKTERTRLKDEYDQKINDEVAKIRSDSSFQKASTSKSSSSKKNLAYYMRGTPQ